MPRKRVERQNTSWRISVEAKRLLELMAEKAGTSQSAVFEAAIREKARREKVTLEHRAGANSSESRRATSPAPPATLDLRPLAERIRSGDEEAAEELRRVIADLRAETVIVPPQRSGPEEWSEEELERRIEQAIEEVRKSRARRG
jgi:hypothetical protein